MKNLFLLILLIGCLFSCGKDTNPYLIDMNRVGPLTREIQINELDSIFENDSIASITSTTGSLATSKEIEIYDKDGTPLLILEPVQQFDSTSTIGYIQILDSRYETEKGLNIKSTFGDVIKNYSISRIENTISSAVVFIDELNLYLTIDKKDLPGSLRYDTDTRIHESQIPDDAKIKYLMISW